MECFGCSASAGSGGGRKKWFVCVMVIMPGANVPSPCLWRAPGSASPAQGPAGREPKGLFPEGQSSSSGRAPAHLGTGEEVTSVVVGMFNLCRTGAEKHGLGTAGESVEALDPWGPVPEGALGCVMGEETQRRASISDGCTSGRVTFALTAWKRLTYYHKKQIYGLSNECKKRKKNPDYARTWRGPRRAQRCQGNACAGL